MTIPRPNSIIRLQVIPRFRTNLLNNPFVPNNFLFYRVFFTVKKRLRNERYKEYSKDSKLQNDNNAKIKCTFERDMAMKSKSSSLLHHSSFSSLLLFLLFFQLRRNVTSCMNHSMKLISTRRISQGLINSRKG